MNAVSPHSGHRAAQDRLAEKPSLKSRLPQLAALALGLASIGAQAQLYTPSVGSLLPGYVQNDDSTFPVVNLGFSLQFFGTTYSSIFINNNGNATFGSGTSSFTPSPLNSQATQPMIAPYWTDLDSRGGGASSGVYLTQSAHQLVATWQDLGYFSGNYSGRTTFQMVLNDPNAPITAGEGVIGFFYDRMTSGTDGHSVTAGFGDGLTAINPGEIAYFAGSSASASAALANTHVWFNLTGGVPVVAPPDVPPVITPSVPEPETYLMMALGLAALAGGAKLRRAKA